MSKKELTPQEADALADEQVTTATVDSTRVSDEAMLQLYIECRDELKKRGLLNEAQEAYKNRNN